MSGGAASSRRGFALPLLLGLILALSMLVAPPAARAEDPGELGVTKTVTGWDEGHVVAPGDTFVYTITISCTNIGSGGCTNTVLTDPLPEGVELDGDASSIAVTPVGAGSASVDGSTVTVDFTQPLDDPPGAQGIEPGTSVEVQIPVRVSDDIDPALSGTNLTNTATADGTNTEPDFDTFFVVPDIPIDLAASTDKSFTPDTAIVAPGDTTTMTLTGGNASNVPVDEITMTDPANPPGPAFGSLAVTGTLDVDLPDGAEQVQVDVWVNGAWINGPPGPPPAVLPAGVDPDEVQGIRVHFISTDDDGIPPGESGSIGVELEQRADITEGTVTNTVSTTVTDAGTTSDLTTATGSYDVTSANLPLDASKSFDPDLIAVGGQSTVTLGATNTSSRTLDSLSITEPGADPNMFTDGLTFSGWGSPVSWPNDATAAEVTFTCADGSTPAVSTETEDTLPDPPDGCVVVGFTVEFTGPIVAGAEASIPFDVTAADDQASEEITHENTISANSTAPGGFVGEATASDTLTTIAERLAVEVDKRISPGSIPAIPGQDVVVLLSGKVLEFPASTTEAHEIIVSDPSDPATSGWYDAFEPIAITETPIPADSTMTVQYWDGTQWVDVPGMVDLAGPQIFSGDLPAEVTENAQGIRFVYESEEGFPPGTEVNPNITYEVTADAFNSDEVVENCAATEATAPGVPDASAEQTPPDCPTVELIPITGGGGGGYDFVDKSWDDPAVGERTGQERAVTIGWSTGGIEHLDRVLVSDIPSPDPDALESSVFDSFDLVRIDPISAGADPLLTFDQVQRLELFSRSQGAWIDAPDDPCPDLCDGTFPGYTLSPASQADAIGMRLVFVESPTRADRINNDPTAPPVGSGVARSSGNDRPIHPVFRLRDELRSNPDVPVLAEDTYNVVGQQGEVRDDAGVDVGDGALLFPLDRASDIITITPVNVTAELTKDWTGGPIGIPEPGTAAFPDEYPTGRVTLDGSNTTPRQVDRLVIQEPLAGAPFDSFNLARFVSITPPQDIGAGALEITLSPPPPGLPSPLNREEALAAAETQLAGVTSFTFNYTGRIDAGGHAVVVFDTRLRQASRSTGAPLTPGTTVDDVAGVTVSDLIDYPGVAPEDSSDTDPATIDLVATGIALEVTKTFSPDEQTEPDRSPVTMTLTGQPEGPTRTNWMAIVDEDTTFFNAYDAVGFGAFTFTAPIDRVQVDAFVDGTFTAAGGTVDRTGGQWVNGTPGGTLALPDGVAWDEVQGLRFTFTRADGALWENPATPLQQVIIQVQRREVLRTGGPVPSDLATNVAAPGEQAAGQTDDTVQGENRGADLVGGAPISATDDATDTILFRHARNSVEVTKAPSGSQPPGVPFDYTLTFTNTGDIPIADPVITDRLPSDADGPLLQFDPNLEPGESPYAFELTGAAAPVPPNGLPMPTAVADVTITQTPGVTPTTIQFQFPAGTVLEVGQTYTITISMMFRDGLSGDTDVTNTAGIIGDRPWDGCEQDLVAGECQASTTVNPTRAGALRGVKAVRAADPVLGVLNTRNYPGGCVKDVLGFYVGGCVPLTKPGGDELWRMRFTNTGNLPQDRLYMIDRLPTPGDTGAITSQQRESQWTPIPKSVTFVGTTRGTATALRLYYDTDQDICTDDLELGQSCAAGEWTLVGEVVDPALGTTLPLPANATAFKVEADYFNVPLQPTGVATIELTTTTPAQSPTAGENTIAWNTVAAAARTVDGDQQGLAPKSEGNKVGVALATGPLEVVKVVTGPAAEYAPAEFHVTVQCTSVGQPVDLGAAANLTLVPNLAQRIEDLPWGSECTVTEDAAAAGDPVFTATTVTVTREDQGVAVVTATNTYPDASLVLRKAVDDSAVDADGSPLTYGPFTFDVSCTYLGEPVFAAGFGRLRPMTASFSSGETVTFTELPAGSTCTASESFTAGANDTTSSGTTGMGTDDEATVEGDTSIDLVLTADGDGASATNEVTFTNVFPTGAVSITKVVDGSGAELLDDPTFLVQLTCRSAADGTVVYDGQLQLGGGRPLTVTVDHLYVDSSCMVTEPGTGGATTTTIAPAGEFPVTAESGGTPVTITVTNTFAIGGLVVGKLLLTERDLPDDISFTLRVDCVQDVDGEQRLIDLGDDNEVVLSPATGMVAAYEELPVGAVCTVTETDDGGADASVVVPEQVVIEADQYVAVVVANVFTGGDDELPDTGGPGTRTALVGLLLLLLGATAFAVSRRNGAAARGGRS